MNTQEFNKKYTVQTPPPISATPNSIPILDQIKILALKDSENTFNIWVSKTEQTAEKLVEKAPVVVGNLYNYYLELYKIAFNCRDNIN